MHFFYLDETGCTGGDLANQDQPVFVLGGVCVRDGGWPQTTEHIRLAVRDFFEGAVPQGFELHASELVNGEGEFKGYGRDDRNVLAHTILDLLTDRSHWIHFVGIEKQKLADAIRGGEHPIFDASVPYLLGFNYMISYIERFVKETLGSSARGMIIFDIKDDYHDKIDAITHYRRFEVAKARRLKWLVEFSYPVDSVRHPMVQVSDLAIFLVRKFLEVDNGYRPDWSDEAKAFFANCYDKISTRVKWKGLIDVPGREESAAHELLRAAHATARPQWRARYRI